MQRWFNRITFQVDSFDKFTKSCFYLLKLHVKTFLNRHSSAKNPSSPVLLQNTITEAVGLLKTRMKLLLGSLPLFPIPCYLTVELECFFRLGLIARQLEIS